MRGDDSNNYQSPIILQTSRVSKEVAGESVAKELQIAQTKQNRSYDFTNENTLTSAMFLDDGKTKILNEL